MVDDEWLLEHMAKVSSLSCILIVIYFLLYSIYRISQMPNNPWNWNEWQWPLGGRHAVEIIRNRTEMPFTMSLVDSRKEALSECTFTVNYLKEEPPPDVTVVWGPTVSYMMKLINSPWHDLMGELKIVDVDPGQWDSLIGSTNTNNNDCSTGELNYFILQRLAYDETSLSNEDIPPESDLYQSAQLVLKPPEEFDWNLLKNQFRYPAAVFITNHRWEDAPPQGTFEINGVIQIIHIKNQVFPKPSATLSQYIKMNNGESHILQSLYVMDDNRADDDDDDDLDAEANSPEDSVQPEAPDPFNKVLCSVCQVMPVTRVIIPCRHVCLCTLCFEKVENCPICRGAIMYYFKTREDPQENQSTDTNSSQTPSEDIQNLTWWQRIERFNDQFSYAQGLIRNS